jgi:hypothetical protein
MTGKHWVSGLSFLCIGFGLAKVLYPLFFLELRNRRPWFNTVDIYSFIFKGACAELAVRINGGLLLIIGIGLAAWVVFG